MQQIQVRCHPGLLPVTEQLALHPAVGAAEHGQCCPEENGPALRPKGAIDLRATRATGAVALAGVPGKAPTARSFHRCQCQN